MQPDPRISRYTAIWLIPGAVIAGVLMIVVGVLGHQGHLAIAGSILIGSLILAGAHRGAEPPELPK